MGGGSLSWVTRLGREHAGLQNDWIQMSRESRGAVSGVLGTTGCLTTAEIWAWELRDQTRLAEGGGVVSGS
jgi:hypothetical protein